MYQARTTTNTSRFILGYLGYISTRYLKCTGTRNKNIPSEHHFQSKTWSCPFPFHNPRNINLQNWSSQETYNNFLQINNTSNLSHHECGFLMILLFDMNRIWFKMAINYKLFMNGSIWMSHVFKRAPFWCTSLIHNRANEQCFISPVLMHQRKHSITTCPMNF